MYKTILVHVDNTARSAERTAVAAALARQYDGHLVGAAMTGLPLYLLPGGGVDGTLALVGVTIEQLRADANRALDAYDIAARAAGATSVERRCIDDEPGVAMAMQARYGDLLVISQAARDAFEPLQRADFPDYVIVHAPRPVLVLPAAGVRQVPGTRVTVAWNGSAEAARAVASAVPLLQRARQVDVVVFNADGLGAQPAEAEGAAIALYLARHGVRVELTAMDTTIDEGASLHGFAADRGADLIVMGAYGRSRFREIMLGGMTRSMLTTSTIPLWMSH